MIVIPMAGLSRRFAEAGYDRPKYMLPLRGGTVFDHSVSSFGAVRQRALPVRRPQQGDAASFLQGAAAALGIAHARVVLLDRPTAGQARRSNSGCTGRDARGGEPRPSLTSTRSGQGFRLAEFGRWGASDGYLEVFRGSGANSSYVPRRRARSRWR